MAATLIILFVGLLAGLLSPVITTGLSSSSTAAKSDEVALWQKTFTRVDIPSTLASKVSPLTPSDVQRYARQMVDAARLASSSTALVPAFCRAAGILCGANIRVAKIAGGHQSYARSEVDRELFKKLSDDPEAIDFFREKDLVEGRPLRLPYLQVPELPARKFLPHQLADSFLLNHEASLPCLLKTLDIPERSNLSWQAYTTMFRCLAPPMKGESKRCVASLQEMIQFVASTIGPHMLLLPPQDASGSQQTGKLLEASLLAGTTSMTCHDNMYPFQVYYCHSIDDTKVYQLKLQLEDGRIINKVATCHMDTSQWPDLHPAFAVLHTRPGESEACHYIVKDDLLFTSTN